MGPSVPAPVTATRQLLLAGVLAAVLTTSACGADAPAGTLTEGDLPDGVEVEQVSRDVQAGQVTCQDVDDAEDNHVMAPSDNYDPDLRAAVSYRLAGRPRESVSDSVWRLARPTEAVAQVADGLAACAEAHPERYRSFEVDGHPDALGYTATEGAPTATYTRRILVPLEDRVVVLTSTREGDDDFSVTPEELLDNALRASADAPTA